MIRIIFGVYLLLIFTLFSQARHTLIDYSQAQAKQVYQLFYGIQNLTYLDIGAYDPIVKSTTLPLYAQGWTGINVQPNPSRFKYFHIVKSRDLSLNFAIGGSNQFVSLYQFIFSSASTISQKVADEARKRNGVQGQITVPALKMGTFCERYIEKKPTFMNLDIEGVGLQALKTNLWQIQKCRPEVILAENNQVNKLTEMDGQDEFMKEVNYTCFKYTGKSDIFIDNRYVEKYSSWFEKNEGLYQKNNVIKLRDLQTVLLHKMQQSGGIRMGQNRYDPTQNTVSIYISTVYETIPIQNLLVQNQQLSIDSIPRNLIILEFDPYKSSLLLHDEHYYLQKIKITAQLSFFNLTIEYQSHSYLVYILNHQEADIKDIKISLKQFQNQSKYFKTLLIVVNGSGFLVVGLFVKKSLGENKRREWEIANEKQGNDNNVQNTD